MTRWVALLKGVNVGGNRRLPMAELKHLVESAGYSDVKTLLASGNVVFTGDDALPAKIEAHLEAEASQRLALNTNFLVRNLPAITAAMAANPYPDAAADRPSRLLVVFLRDPAPADLVERIAAVHSGPERLATIGHQLYIDYIDGETMRASKLSQAMAKAKAPLVATARNWNTVQKIEALLAG